MIAVVQIGGHQAIVKTGDTLTVDLQKDIEPGKTFELPVLLLAKEDGSSVSIGAPILEGKTVTAKLIESGKGDKTRVFKMNPRKRYRRTYGHRQPQSVIEITKIPGGTATKKAAEATAE